MATHSPRVIITFALFLPFSASAEYLPNDFDKVCIFFTDMSKLTKIKKMTSKQRYQYINKRIITGLDPKGPAAIAWKTVSSAKATQRYDLFSTTAQTTLRQPWSCNAMQLWADKTGRIK